jgi:3-phenylpropionate/cinnamic acid dioxygenase small subunit
MNLTRTTPAIRRPQNHKTRKNNTNRIGISRKKRIQVQINFKVLLLTKQTQTSCSGDGFTTVNHQHTTGAKTQKIQNKKVAKQNA